MKPQTRNLILIAGISWLAGFFVLFTIFHLDPSVWVYVNDVKWYQDDDLTLREQLILAAIISPVAGLIAAIPVTGIWIVWQQKKARNDRQSLSCDGTSHTTHE